MTDQIKHFRKTKYTCYFTYVSTSAVFSLPALLFMTFREMYGISYTLLGTLVLINFCTQLSVDLIFSFFSKYFNIPKTIRTMPLLTCLGFFVYALTPFLFPQHIYLGLALGTVIFSVSAGLSEVFLSPLVAALPSDNPERDMSTLHSLYAYGVLTVVCVSTLFLKVFGSENWMYLAMLWGVLPIITFVLFCIVPMPEINMSHGATGNKAKKNNIWLALCVASIFLGSATENTMTNWISGYMESALGLPKATGDILGLAAFAVLLGICRTLYAKYGKNISNVLLVGMIGGAACYIVAALSGNVMISMAACVLTGMFTSMLWPGNLILLEDVVPHPGVTAYAMMAAGGDFGASVAPQMLGAIADTVAESDWAAKLGNTLSMSPEQIGMKTGMLISAVFPIIGTVLLIVIRKRLKKQRT